jgi:dipeptidyl aminopeptidase/acylaminoacyl peptidase
MERLTADALVYATIAASDPQVSPDGTRVTYTLSRADRDLDRSTTQVYLSAIDGADVRQLTRAGDRNREPRWSPDGTQIAFVSDRVEGHSVLCVLPITEPGEAQELTRHGQPVGNFAWSPDGASIAYTTAFDPDNPDEQPLPKHRAPRVRVTRRLDYKQDNRGWLNDVRTQVFVVDTRTRERRRLTSESHDLWFPEWSADGGTLAARATIDNGIFSRLVLIDTATAETRRVGPELGSVGVWSWSPSGDRILFSGDEKPTPGAEIYVYDVATASITCLTTDLPCLPDVGFPSLSGPSQPVWLNDDEVLFHAMRGGESCYYRFNLRNGQLDREYATRSVSAGFSIDAAHRFIAQSCSSLGGPSEVAIYDRQTGQHQLITRHNVDLLQAAAPARWERFDLERDGTTIEAWLLKPADFHTGKQYPLVLDVHGGPHSFHGYAFNVIQQVLASHGFVVVYANPRGSGSYGREFAEMVRTDWGGEDYLDLMAVVDAALERPYIDRERTGIWGYSYGGFMTAWTIGHTPRFKAAVCGAPCFDLESMYGTSDISHAWGPYEWGGKPHEASEAFAAHSPSTFAHRATTPTLIIHGEADNRCPIGQGEQMFVALKQAGCEVEFARYPGGAHTMLRVGPPSHRVDILERLLGWFIEHLGCPST